MVYANDGEGVGLLELLGANVGLQPLLLGLLLVHLHVPPLHNSTPFFDALLASQITSLTFTQCNLGVNFAAGLACLLQAGRLTRLQLISCRGVFTLEATAQLSHALRHSRSLCEFVIWNCDGANAVLDLILRALQFHPTLEALTLGYLRFSAAARDSLLRMIRSDSTTLQSLKLVNLRETMVGLSALAGALLHNRHLRDLHLNYEGVFVPTASAYQEHLLPAVLACSSLLRLIVDYNYDDPVPDAAAAVQLVADREAARLAAELAKEPGRSA